MTGQVRDGGWHHLACAYDGANVSLYLDGAFVSSTAATGALEASTNNLVIGSDGAGATWKGSIDDARIYSRGLSATEIKQLYNEGLAKINKTPTNKMTSGLVGVWSFDGPDVTDKVYDRSGQGNNGYFIGGATTTAKVIGKMGQALKFDGVDDYVVIPDIASIDSNPTLSYGGWLKFPIADDGLIRENFGQNRSGFDVFGLRRNTTETVNCMMRTSSQVFAPSTTGALRDTRWHHVFCVYNGATISVYVDGVLSGTPVAQTGNLNSRTDAICIGSASLTSTTCGSSPSDATMDDMRIYNRALSAAEVKQLYNMGK